MYCPLCSNRNIITVETISEELSMAQCMKCYLIFSSNMNINFNYNEEKTHYRWEIKIVIEQIRKLLNKKRIKILEIGSGDGRHLTKLKRIFKDKIELYATDLANHLVSPEICFIEFQELLRNKKIFLNKFDVVFAFHVLEHVPDPLLFLKQALSLLRPHGKLIISVPNPARITKKVFKKESWDNPPYHLTRWNKKVFKNVADLLKVSNCTVINSPFSIYDYYILIHDMKVCLSSKRNVIASISKTKRTRRVNTKIKGKFFPKFRIVIVKTISSFSAILGTLLWIGIYFYARINKSIYGMSLIAILKK